MPIILFIILANVLLLSPVSANPLLLSLTSADQTKEIPPRNQCSCQLLVFGVYGDTYTLKVKAS